MQIYSMICQITEKLTEEELIKLIIEWNQGSPHNKMSNIMWDGINRNIKFEENNLSLAIEELREHRIIAIRFYQLDENNVIWTTDVVVNFEKKVFSIKIDRETTEDTKAFIPQFKTPLIVNLLLERGYVGKDDEIEISGRPIIINKSNYTMIENVILRKSEYKMPVIYVTKSWGKYPFNVSSLAYKLRGVAHVLLEEDNGVSKILRTTCNEKNAHHGSVGIYYPSSSANCKIISTAKYEGREKILVNQIVEIVNRYANQQARDKMLTWEGVQNEILKLRYKSAAEKRTQAESEVDEVYSNFGQELEEKERTIEELNNRIIALRAECQGLRTKIDNMDEIPLLNYGQEEEFYEGEIKDHILEILVDAKKRIVPDCRRDHILNDVLECNKKYNELDIRRDKVKKILKGYTKVGDSIKRELKEFGFEIEKEGGHYKLTYKGDSRYLFTMASSGSDSQHGGGNLAAEIIKKML